MDEGNRPEALGRPVTGETFSILLVGISFFLLRDEVYSKRGEEEGWTEKLSDLFFLSCAQPF